jgi:putative PIN family toxin of toxin-antitoxin system
VGAVKIEKVVIDTNVVVSGLLFGGVPGEIVRLWKERRIRPLCSREIVEEYLRVLAYPRFALTESEIDFLLSQEILLWFEVVHVEAGKAFVKADPSDDKFIWCALAGKADAVISGDEHLLRLRSSPVPILSVREFLKGNE